MYKVKCDECNKSFNLNSEDYLKVSGNLHVGEKGGLIGNNFNENMELINENHFCPSCFFKTLPEKIQTEILQEEGIEISDQYIKNIIFNSIYNNYDSSIVFKPIDQQLRYNIKTLIESYVSYYVTEDCDVKCDEENNRPQDVYRCILKADVFIKNKRKRFRLKITPERIFVGKGEI